MMTDKPDSLHSLLCAGGLLRGVGARDALDARLIEEAGFDFVWASSFCISAAHCVPDSSILSMTQFLDAARAMNEAVGIPVVFDADTGYGDEHNVAYAARRIEEAGMAALCIEDKTFPKNSSLRSGARQQLLAIEEFTRKIRSATSARRNRNFVVIARTEALIAGLGHHEALRRARAYEAAGADCILLHSKSRTPDEILDCVRAWSGRARLVLVPTNYANLTEPAIEALGNVAMVIYGNHCVRAAVKAVRSMLKEMRTARGAHTIRERIATVDEVFSLQENSGNSTTANET
jgi:phosphonopyruvate hydrolase